MGLEASKAKALLLFTTDCRELHNQSYFIKLHLLSFHSKELEKGSFGTFLILYTGDAFFW